jgi:uncharacterized membrane protein
LARCPDNNPEKNMKSPVTSGFDLRAYRLSSIDMVRGLIIIIMALDHVRDFTMAGAIQDPMRDPHVGALLFFTRWITHFCAPVFIFLAGTSAGLMTSRKSPNEMAAFLLKRGVWLLFIEVVLLSTAITFSPFAFAHPGGHTVLIMQVLSAIGVGMIVLAGAQYLGAQACLAVGALIVLGHNLLDGVWPTGTFSGNESPLWVSLHSSMGLTFEHVQIFFIYPFLPWIGVMLLGFGSAGLFRKLPDRRNTLLFRIGLGLIAAFLVLRGFDWYGDALKWRIQPEGELRTLMSFLNTTKYPPSLLYLLMTLGPAAILCACSDYLRGWIKDTLVMFGRVPFAFYVTHFYLAHALGVAIGLFEGYTLDQLTRSENKAAGVNLPGVYLVWIIVVATLYPFCRWVASVKARRSDWWLSYL